MVEGESPEVVGLALMASFPLQIQTLLLLVIDLDRLQLIVLPLPDDAFGIAENQRHHVATVAVAGRRRVFQQPLAVLLVDQHRVILFGAEVGEVAEDVIIIVAIAQGETVLPDCGSARCIVGDCIIERFVYIADWIFSPFRRERSIHLLNIGMISQVFRKFSQLIFFLLVNDVKIEVELSLQV